MDMEFNLGEHIYQRRMASNMSQTDLANALNVSRQSVSKWENNMAVPDLDKLVNMSHLFDVTIDELVHGAPPPPRPATSAPKIFDSVSTRIVVGAIMLLFGLIFFLLSIFWGNHLYFGEEVGELISMVITLVGISLLATHNFKIWTACAVTYALYVTICVGLLHVSSIANYLFTFIMSIVILVWFITWGQHAGRTDFRGK